MSSVHDRQDASQILLLVFHVPQEFTRYFLRKVARVAGPKQGGEGRNGKAPLRIGRQVGMQWKSTLLVIFTSTPGQLIKTSWASCQFEAIK